MWRSMPHSGRDPTTHSIACISDIEACPPPDARQNPSATEAIGPQSVEPTSSSLHHNSTALLESKHSHLSNRPDVIERPELACVSSAQNGSKSTGHFITACWPMALTRPWLR